MDSDAQLLLARDLYLDDCSVLQVILEHHVNSVAGSERILNMRDRGGAQAELERVIGDVGP